MDRIKEEWIEYVIEKDEFESFDMRQNVDRVADWWLSKLSSELDKARNENNAYISAHCQYVAGTLEGIKPEEAWKTLQAKIDSLPSLYK